MGRLTSGRFAPRTAIRLTQAKQLAVHGSSTSLVLASCASTADSYDVHRLEFLDLFRSELAVNWRHAAILVHQRQTVDLDQVVGREFDFQRLDILGNVLSPVGSSDN